MSRHAAEEIVCHDFGVEDGYAGVEIMGGTDDDLDTIYDLAEVVRREHEQRRKDYEKHKTAGTSVPVPPWRRREDYW